MGLAPDLQSIDTRLSGLEALFNGLSSKLDAVLADIPGTCSSRTPPNDAAETLIRVHEARFDDLGTRLNRIEVLLFRTSVKDFGVLDANIAALLPCAAQNDRPSATHAERQTEALAVKVPVHDQFHPEEQTVPGLPGVSFIPASRADANLHACALLRAFGSDLKDLSVQELHSTVLHRAEESVKKMLESNAAIRVLDCNLEDEFLRETVEENEKLIAAYREGLVQLQRQIREGLAGVVALPGWRQIREGSLADGQDGTRSCRIADNGLSL